jgi:hypothetical protein
MKVLFDVYTIALGGGFFLNRGSLYFFDMSIDNDAICNQLISFYNRLKDSV